MKKWDIVMAHDMKRPFIGYVVGELDEDYEGEPAILCRFWVDDSEIPYLGSTEAVKLKHLEVLATEEQVARIQIKKRED